MLREIGGNRVSCQVFHLSMKQCIDVCNPQTKRSQIKVLNDRQTHAQISDKDIIETHMKTYRDYSSHIHFERKGYES
jgi:hypothetical protein